MGGASYPIPTGLTQHQTLTGRLITAPRIPFYHIASYSLVHILCVTINMMFSKVCMINATNVF